MTGVIDALLNEVQDALRPGGLRARLGDAGADRIQRIQDASAFLYGQLQAISHRDPHVRQQGVDALQRAWRRAEGHRAALRDAEDILANAGPGGGGISDMLAALRAALDGGPLTEAALGEALEGPLEAAREVGQRAREAGVAQAIQTEVSASMAGFTLPFGGIGDG